MATIITDELRLLIKAEAKQAIKELGLFKSGLEAVESAQRSASGAIDRSAESLGGQAEAMRHAKEILVQTNQELADKALADSLVRNTLSEQQAAQNHLNETLAQATRLRNQGMLTDEQYYKVMAKEAQAVYDLSGLARDRSSAEQMVSSLLTTEQTAQNHLNETMAEAARLKSEGLLTDGQYIQLLQRENALVEDASGLTRDKAAAQQLIDDAMSDSEREQSAMNRTLAEANRLKAVGLLSEKDYQAVVAKAKASYDSAAKGSESYSNGMLQIQQAQSVVKTSALAMGKAMLVALGPIATITGTIMAVKNFIGDANDAYAQSEGEARKFAITYRDVAKDAEQAAKDWAETFKYAESTAKSVLGTAGDMYTGMGMSGDAALQLAQRTTYLGGALSKLNPQIGSAADATKSLITATTGEREALKTWGIIISEAAIQTKLLERGQQDLTGAALLNAKAQATLDVAYEQSPNALAAVTSATELAADTNRELSESWKEFLELGGLGMNRFFQPIKKALAGFVQDMNEARKAQLDLMEIDPNVELIESYAKTADRVDELADTYENLKAKTSLSKSEQADLKAVMAEIATLVPASVTAWNDYGEAIGVSALAARNFATQQRELRIAEAEYQMLRLQYQQSVAKAEYETNKASLQNTSNQISETQKLLTARSQEFIAARMIKNLLESPPKGVPVLDSVMKYIRDNKEVLDGTAFDLTNVELDPFKLINLGLAANTLVGEYDRLSKKMRELEIEKAKYTLGTKEYDLYTAQIKQAEAELTLLTGSQEDQARVLEDQIGPIRELQGEFLSLRGHYEAGTISLDQYIAALQRLLNKSKEAGDADIDPPAPDLTKWEAFIKGLGATSGISLADIEVQLSPVIDPDEGRALLAEELQHYQGLINQLWQNRDAFKGLQEWKTALDELVEKYDEVKDRSDAASLKDSLATPQQKAAAALEKTLARANELRTEGLLTEKELAGVVHKAQEDHDDASGLTKDSQRAQELINTTLTDQQAAMQEVILLETELKTLQDEGLVTEEQSKAILEARIEALSDALGKEEDLTGFIKDSWKEIKDNYFSIDAMGKLMTDTFADIGEALASGGDVLAASGKALQAFVSNLLGEISTMAIGAGLRVIVESGWAGVPLALALFALGGVAGIGSGFFGGSGSGLDGSISDAVSDEIELRQSLNEALEEQLGIEETLLRRQLDRNLIGEEDYRGAIQAIQQQKNQGQAQSDALGLANSLIGDIDTELSGMSGWTKFWTQQDENLKEKASGLEGLAKAINAAVSADELRALIAQLGSYGIDTSSIPEFATGGSFVTSGEQLIRVGDNSSGRELVNITPLGSGGMAAGRSVVININGPVYGWDELVRNLDAAGLVMSARKRR